MILVDTNVWSEAFRAEPDPSVRTWAAKHVDELWLSTVVIGELLSGVALMPDGRRRNGLHLAYENLFLQHEDRIAPFDLDAARHYGSIVAEQKRLGRDPGTADSQIVAIARSRNMKLATRNIRHFDGLGIDLINPWQP